MCVASGSHGSVLLGGNCLNDPVVYADSSEYDTGVSWVPGDFEVGA